VTDELERLYRECADRFANPPGAETPRRLVFGDGNAQKPPLMLIGEAPGEQEALQGRPFVGKAGKNLTEFLAVLGLNREEIYISNVVKYRPTRVSAAGRTVNRPPTRTEIGLFSPYLYREVAVVAPGALVTLGNVALGAFAPGRTIGDCHGQWQTVTVTPETGAAISIPLFALYHPASIIYNRALASVYHEDLLKLKTALAD
jgi:uracil-DNA glycosylase family 4